MTVTPPPPTLCLTSGVVTLVIRARESSIFLSFSDLFHSCIILLFFSFTSLALSSFLFFLFIFFSSSLLPFLFISFPFVHYLLPFLSFIPLSPFLYFFLFSKLARNSADRNAIPNPRRPHLLTESGCRIEETEEPKRLSDRQSPSSSLRRTE